MRKKKSQPPSFDWKDIADWEGTSWFTSFKPDESAHTHKHAILWLCDCVKSNNALLILLIRALFHYPEPSAFSSVPLHCVHKSSLGLRSYFEDARSLVMMSLMFYRQLHNALIKPPAFVLMIKQNQVTDVLWSDFWILTSLSDSAEWVPFPSPVY